MSMFAALKQQYGIELSPSTSSWIMANNRDLYGMKLAGKEPKPIKAMPFATTATQSYWSVDICGK